MDIGQMPLITRLQHLDLKNYLPFDILTKVDRASMASSLEVRVPLLDHHVVERAATLPAELKLRWSRDHGRLRISKKHVLKSLLRRRFADDFDERPKMGFGVPLGGWFATTLRAEVEHKLLRSPVLFNILSYEVVAKLVEEHSPSHDNSTKLWNLLFLEEWMRCHDDALPSH